MGESKRKLVGVYTVMPTPFTEDYELDLEALRDNTRFLLENGITEGRGVLVPTGAAGEGPALTFEEHEKVIKAVVEEVAGKTPVVPGVTLHSTREAARLCRVVQDLGGMAVQLSPPYYSQPSSEEILNHYRAASEAAPNLGIVLYNTPWSSKVDMDAELISRLLSIENIVGAKWSSPDQANYTTVLRRFAKRISLIDNQLPYSGPWGHMLGARGFVSAIANFAPAYDLKLWDLLERHDYMGAVEQLERFAIPFYELIIEIARQGIHGEASHWKAAMELMGRPCGPARPPYVAYNAEQKARLREALTSAGLSPSPARG